MALWWVDERAHDVDNDTVTLIQVADDTCMESDTSGGVAETVRDGRRDHDTRSYF